MALNLEQLAGGWQIIVLQDSAGNRELLDVKGEGARFEVPGDIAVIRKRAFSPVNCPNLEEVYLPETVETIRQDAFDGYDGNLTIRCQAKKRPSGYFEGEYREEFVDGDGQSYFFTHYGSWLHRSVVLHSRDEEGTITWLSPTAEEEIKVRPKVSWNCEAPVPV